MANDEDLLAQAMAASGDEAIPLYERAIAEREREKGDVAEACRQLALHYLAAGDTDGARRAADRALAADDSDDSHLLQADVLRTEGDLDGALQLYKKLRKNEELACQALRGAGNIYLRQGNAKKARKSFAEAIELAEEGSFLAGQLAEGMGQVATLERDGEEAREHFTQALEIFLETVGEKHADTAVCLNNLGLSWVNDDEPLEGAAAFQYALAIGEHLYPPDHPYQATTLSNLAYCASEMERPEQAVAYGERALAMQVARRGPADPDVAISISNLCHYQRERGRDDLAAPLLARIAEHADELAASDRADTAGVLFSIGTLTLELLHDVPKAARLYAAALGQRERLCGLEDEIVLNTARNAAAHLFEGGGRAEAETLLAAAIDRWTKAEEHDDDAIESVKAHLDGVRAGDRDAVLEDTELEEDDEDEDDEDDDDDDEE
jgi:Tfp pilus assembly protein PilF